jgi:hypothetical protein
MLQQSTTCCNLVGWQAQADESQSALSSCKAALETATADLAEWEAGVGVRQMQSLQVTCWQL